MKKSFIFYPLLIFSTVFSQQVELINDWDEAAVPEGLFAPSSPYRLLQDMLIKDHIFLKTLDKTTSPIYKTKEKHSKIKEKIEKLLSQHQKRLCFSDDPQDKLILWNLPKDLPLAKLQAIEADRMILFALDPRTVQIIKENASIKTTFYKIYTWDDDLVDDKHFFKFHLPSLQKMDSNLPTFASRKLSLAASDLKEVACSEHLASLKNVKFFFCDSETKFSEDHLGLVFKAFSAGAIPISFQPERVRRFIPSQCFIDASAFSSALELHQHLSTLSEETYKDMLSQIGIFLESKEAQEFSLENFSRTMQEALKS